MQGTPVNSTLKRLPISTSMPGFGFRHSHFASAVCGQKKIASSRAPACDERLVHLLVDRVQHRHVEEAAADAGLVGRDDDPVAGVVEPGDRLEAARHRPPLVRRLDEVLAVVVHDAVAVEDDEPHRAGRDHRFGGELDHYCASFEMSATRFIVAATPRSSARRLARIAGSSAITITSSKYRSTAGLAVASARSAPAKSPLP